MKLTLCSAIGLSLLLASCSSLDPEYAEYKKKKKEEAEGGAQSPFAPGADPYGTNPYGVPGGSETGTYSPNAPIQPLPGVPNPGSPDPINPGTYPQIPPAPPSGAGNTVSHVVVKGDSLWGLARRYETTVEAIQQANGMTGSTIRTGQTLQIPR